MVCVLSGGNMDVITMASLVQHGLINAGPHLHLLRPAPRPSRRAAAASSDLLAQDNGNVIKLEHNQFVNINRQNGVELKVTLEAFGHDHKDRILEALEPGRRTRPTRWTPPISITDPALLTRALFGEAPTSDRIQQNRKGIFEMDFEALQATRESCRVYSDRPVPRETLAHLVDVARLAPSGCNAQPWRFIIIDEPEARAKLIEALDDDGLTGCPWGDRAAQLHPDL